MEVTERLRVLTAASWRIQFFWDMTLCHWLSGSQFWKIIFPSLSDVLHISLVLRKRMIFSSRRLLDHCRWRNYGASKHQEFLTQWLNITSQKTRIHIKVAWWKVQTLWGMIQHLKAQVSQNITDKGAIYGQVLSPYMITPLWRSHNTYMQWTHGGLKGFHIITVVWLVDETQHQGTEGQSIYPVWRNSALGIPALNCVTLLPFALICPFCCTAIGWTPVRQAHSHIFTCDWLYSLQPSGFI